MSKTPPQGNLTIPKIIDSACQQLKIDQGGKTTAEKFVEVIDKAKPDFPDLSQLVR